MEEIFCTQLMLCSYASYWGETDSAFYLI